VSDNKHLGAVALVGSGEYTSWMRAVDSALLATVGGPSTAKVALIPVASAASTEGADYWNRKGWQHFTDLGVTDIRLTAIVDAITAMDAQQLALLADANFFYLSGGDPIHSVNSLRGSPTWNMLVAAHQRGAVIVGSSAGAMTMGSQYISARHLVSTSPTVFKPALALIPNIAVFPHFDALPNPIFHYALQLGALRPPPGCLPIGIDEDTAFVQLGAPSLNGTVRWQVMGRRSVTIHWPDGQTRRYPSGSEVMI